MSDEKDREDNEAALQELTESEAAPFLGPSDPIAEDISADRQNQQEPEQTQTGAEPTQNDELAQRRASSEFKSRLNGQVPDDKPGHLNSPQPPEEVLAAASEYKKARWLSIFIQLSRCERFLKFTEMNYQIVDKIDEEKKTIDTTVYENPRAVGPPMEPRQRAKLYQLLRTHNAQHPQKLFQEIIDLFSQNEEKSALIPSATAADVAAAAGDQDDLKKKLD
jgi:hypothetical protein